VTAVKARRPDRLIGPLAHRGLRGWPVAAALLCALAAAGCERINADAPAGGSARLSWTAVTTDIGGTQLHDLAGYRVYYGTSARALYSVVVVPDPRATSYEVTDLAPGTWYFGVAAYTSANVQGALSNVGSKTIR